MVTLSTLIGQKWGKDEAGEGKEGNTGGSENKADDG